MNIGIVGARKYKNKQPVVELVNSLSVDNLIITSGCKGVCTWAKDAAEARGMRVKVYAPDLENIRAWFEVPKRYYDRNKEMVEACDLLHAFISEEEGFIGGTRFEIEYAVSLGIPVQIHWENGPNQWRYQYHFEFMTEKPQFFLSWEQFFCKTDLQFGGLK